MLLHGNAYVKAILAALWEINCHGGGSKCKSPVVLPRNLKMFKTLLFSWSCKRQDG